MGLEFFVWVVGWYVLVGWYSNGFCKWFWCYYCWWIDYCVWCDGVGINFGVFEWFVLGVWICDYFYYVWFWCGCLVLWLGCCDVCRLDCWGRWVFWYFGVFGVFLYELVDGLCFGIWGWEMVVWSDFWFVFGCW